ncbi:MAG: hypothetical protein HY525_00060 [Betaproteobacteria bacterium]|nr:hypothetical protein [Betaproteobacteria bacterium]
MLRGTISLAAGLALLSVSELAGLAYLRIVAAVLLVAGAVDIGIAAGRKPRVAGMLKRIGGIFSRAAVCVAAAVLAAPVLTVLIGSLAGAATQLFNANSVIDMPLVITGGVVGLLLLTATLTALVVGIGAILGKAPDQAAEEKV